VIFFQKLFWIIIFELKYGFPRYDTRIAAACKKQANNIHNEYKNENDEIEDVKVEKKSVILEKEPKEAKYYSEPDYEVKKEALAISQHDFTIEPERVNSWP